MGGCFRFYDLTCVILDWALYIVLWLLQVGKTRYTKYRYCIDTIGRRYESIKLRQKVFGKKLYTLYGYKILIFIQYNIDHR